MDSEINPTSLSKSHISVGPEIMTMPIAMVNAIENLGIITRDIFSLAVVSNFESAGSNVKTK